ncbi:hypothetical protein V9T40_011728 [Parthenolecanium corni]|uniref:Uncharacterized protein n=1 Tax=Parthenolecanium corni TaxID=536013 RepID=A0AAN9TJ85_9HEMI
MRYRSMQPVIPPLRYGTFNLQNDDHVSQKGLEARRNWSACTSSCGSDKFCARDRRYREEEPEPEPEPGPATATVLSLAVRRPNGRPRSDANLRNIRVAGGRRRGRGHWLAVAEAKAAAGTRARFAKQTVRRSHSEDVRIVNGAGYEGYEYVYWNAAAVRTTRTRDGQSGVREGETKREKQMEKWTRVREYAKNAAAADEKDWRKCGAERDCRDACGSEYARRVTGGSGGRRSRSCRRRRPTTPNSHPSAPSRIFPLTLEACTTRTNRWQPPLATATTGSRRSRRKTRSQPTNGGPVPPLFGRLLATLVAPPPKSGQRFDASNK